MCNITFTCTQRKKTVKNMYDCLLLLLVNRLFSDLCCFLRHIQYTHVYMYIIKGRNIMAVKT